MPGRVPRILLLYDDDSLEARMARACEESGRYRLRRVRSWDELRAELADAPPSTVAVPDAVLGGDGRTPAPELGEAMRMHPLVTFIPAVRHGPRFVPLVVNMLDYGIGTVFAPDLLHVSTAAILHTLDRDSGYPCTQLVDKLLKDRVELASGWNVLVSAARSLAYGGALAELPRMVGVPREEVLFLCRRSGLPHPRRLVDWVRLLLASHLLDCGEKVGAVSRAAGYRGEGQLRVHAYEMVGIHPEPLQLSGAVDAVRTAFIREVVCRQEERRRRRRGW